jgi:hypothetical protein
MMNIFDPEFSSIARSDLYRSFALPELFPEERPPRLANWSAEDREMWCGGEFTRGY